MYRQENVLTLVKIDIHVLEKKGKQWKLNNNCDKHYNKLNVHCTCM